ncbi:2-phosphosulfolactate phosphatase [Caldimonas tepidiphila]|uniref:2-phosphosulfolactate phosphatase n=1 Tax=Caldimonas tepidiphila TaxID=2315841 RepID=UPI000E5C001F|nr:2-phosphosulfolactate phosphatase [Caldimonas tepidiphila]
MTKVHVLLKKEELDGQRLDGKVVVVLDVLFATSTMVAALAHGAAEVIPTLDGDAARRHALEHAPGCFVLAGELDAVTLDGFTSATPQAVLREMPPGGTLIYSTTNGTVALARAAAAPHVYAAALLNGEAVVERIVREHGDATVLLVCSGSADRFNLEDFYGAGYLVSLFHRAGVRDFTDAAQAAGLLHQGSSAEQCLWSARVGRHMLRKDLEDELRFAARKSCLDVVPKLVDGRLRAT